MHVLQISRFTDRCMKSYLRNHHGEIPSCSYPPLQVYFQRHSNLKERSSSFFSFHQICWKFLVKSLWFKTKTNHRSRGESYAQMRGEQRHKRTREMHKCTQWGNMHTKAQRQNPGSTWTRELKRVDRHPGRPSPPPPPLMHLVSKRPPLPDWWSSPGGGGSTAPLYCLASTVLALSHNRLFGPLSNIWML